MLYAIFALATAATAVVLLFHPVIKQIIKENPESTVSSNKVVSYATLFTISLLVAPLLFIIVIIPELGERFKESLEQSLSAPDIKHT